MAEESLSFDIIHPTPLLVVISGPSGVGKDAVVKAMQKRGAPFHFVVTMPVVYLEMGKWKAWITFLYHANSLRS